MNFQNSWKAPLVGAVALGGFTTLMSGSAVMGGVVSLITFAVSSMWETEKNEQIDEEMDRLESLEELINVGNGKRNFTYGNKKISINEIPVPNKNKIVYSFYYEGRLEPFMLFVLDEKTGKITEERLHIFVTESNKERYLTLMKKIKKEILLLNQFDYAEEEVEMKKEIEEDEVVKKAKDIVVFAGNISEEIPMGNFETKHLLTEGIKNDVKKILSNYLSFSEETKMKNKQEILETLNVIQSKIVSIYYEVEHKKVQEMETIKTVIRQRYK